jgi:hypothetical protein
MPRGNYEIMNEPFTSGSSGDAPGFRNPDRTFPAVQSRDRKLFCPVGLVRK